MPALRHISRLRLNQYRNYAAAGLDLDGRHVVLTGPNGAGKTNLLEALSLFSPGRGLRRASFANLSQAGSSSPWAVAITLETPDGPVDIGTGSAETESGRRVRINGANAKSIEAMSAYIRLLWLTPDMDGLFRGGASDRRRFLDRLVMTLVPDHVSAVGNYEKSMRQRNKLLEGQADTGWLDAIEAQMAEHAAALYFARADSLGHLQRLATAPIDTDAFPAARLTLTPLFEDAHEPVSSSALENQLIDLWRDLRRLDRAAGRTTVGPHRVDLEVTHAQKNMPASLCSTGEQKALLIGLVLAHAGLVSAMAGITPLMLLDEVAAHLDPERRKALFDALDRLGAQCWMTGTDAVLFESMGPDAQHIAVDGGRLTEIDPKTVSQR